MKSVSAFLSCLSTVLCLVSLAAAQPIGNTYVAGTTWYDLQSNDAGERMVAVGVDGQVHVAWTNGLTSNIYGPRHVYYNRWNPDSQRFAYDTTGVQVDQGGHAGYATLSMWSSDCPVVAYHTSPRSGGMLYSAISYCLVREFPVDTTPSIEMHEWPHMAISSNGRIHLLTAMSSVIPEDYGDIYYAQAQIRSDSDDVQWRDFGGGNPFLLVERTRQITHSIASSSRSAQRVALCWTRPGVRFEHNPDSADYYDYDIALKISEDDGESWGPELDVTNFVPGDTACLRATGDTLRCDRDTLRSPYDACLLFDNNNVVHIAFTTIGYWTWRTGSSEGAIGLSEGLIWHWCEATAQFSLVADGWIASDPPGAWQRIVCRPSLAIDPTDGYLYCAYMRYDTVQTSEGGFYNSDVWISVSTDNGISWSTGTNVTRTRPAIIPAPAGQCLSEREPTLAETVSDGLLHLTYVLDLDAGAYPNSEGTATLNNFIYQRIPVDSIATTPLMPRYPLHWDSTGFLTATNRNSILHPSSFILSVYPNPFNSTAVITFELPARSQTTLKVFDLLGRDVTTLREGMLEAGEHTVRWDASRCASGIYFVSLRTKNAVRTQKVMLLK